MSTKALSELRVGIAELRTRRDQLKYAPPSRDEIKNRLTPHLKTESDALRRSIGHALLSDIGGSLKLRVSPSGHVDLAPVMALLLGVPAVTKALTACLDGYVADNAPSAAEKAAELEDIDSRLYGLELAEEAEVVRLEALGQRVSRRADAKPEIVLAMIDDQGNVL